jgi:DNA-binding protein HU-beta
MPRDRRIPARSDATSSNAESQEIRGKSGQDAREPPGAVACFAPVVPDSTIPDNHQESPTMNRRELVAALAERLDTDKRTADAHLTAFTETITATVSKGEVVVISGFAKFARVDRPARMGRNPQTGEAIRIKASRRARITPLKAFKDAVLTGRAAPAKKAPAKKAAPAKKTVARRAPVKKAAPAKKAVAKKTVAKKTVARKAPAKKATRR